MTSDNSPVAPITFVANVWRALWRTISFDSPAVSLACSNAFAAAPPAKQILPKNPVSDWFVIDKLLNKYDTTVAV
jgi:hypothetical protein